MAVFACSSTAFPSNRLLVLITGNGASVSNAISYVLWVNQNSLHGNRTIGSTMMNEAGNDILNTVIDLLKAENRDLRSVTLEEAKQLTLHVIRNRQKITARTKIGGSC